MVIMIGCFDTKAEDLEYLFTCLKDKNVEVLTLNTGVLGTTDQFPVHFEPCFRIDKFTLMTDTGHPSTK